jgi:hypothetical protein
MKTKILILITSITLGIALPGWTRQLPIGPGVALSGVKVGLGVWTKKGSANGFIENSVVEIGPWYRNCPVMPNVILNSKHESEVTLSNGKRIMLSWAGLKSVVEADLNKYAPYEY